MSRPAFALSLALVAMLAACHQVPAEINAGQVVGADNGLETLDASADGLAAPSDGNAANMADLDN